LQQMVAAEIARRQESENQKPAFWFVAHDQPGALTDIRQAVAAIVERTDGDDQGKPIYVAHSIEKAVMDALQAAHPKRYVMCNSVVDSARRHAPVPETSETAAPSAPIEIDRPGEPPRPDEDVASRAAERIARLRGL
jgi:hypothetical protein